MAEAAVKTIEKEKINTGIKKGPTKDMAEALSNALADTYSLYLKTLGVHWNITGASFYSVHKLTEEQYEDMHGAIDELAERIRALGFLAPASFGDYSKLSVIDNVETPDTADKMIQSLIKGNEAISRRLRDFVEKAEDADDVFTADMLTARIGKHEQNGWMLRALVE